MDKVRYQDDLYLAVNGEWLESAVIPDDRPTAGGFSQLDQDVEKLMMKDFNEFKEGRKTTSIPEMKSAIALYNKYLEVEKRNLDGIKPVLPLLEKIKNIKSMKDLNDNAKELCLNDVDLPINFGVEPDMKDATKHSFIILGPDIILPDTSYYQNNPTGEKLLEVYSSMVKQILTYTPLTDEEQEEYIKDTLSFDAMIAKEVKSQLEWANYVDNYNPMKLDEVESYLKDFDIESLLSSIYGKKIEDVVIYDVKAIKNFSNYFSEKTLPLYVHWAYVKTLLKACSYLSEELYSLATTYTRTLRGVSKDPVLEKRAYHLVSRIYSEPVGVYYGREYFGEEAKKDVVNMVKLIIETYKDRMRKNTFLEEETKEKAILKLDTIVIKMGYPDKIDDFYSSLTIDDSDSLFSSMNKITTKRIIHNLEKLGKEVDRSEWGMPGHMVNACYNPSSNDITFPAAILQKPFYSIKQSVSENLGGIGAVIGHEISHAFDNNGAQFDEKGNLKNWWTEKDYAAFKALTRKMIEEFDGISYYGGTVNGELIVSENIADNGGMGVTLAIMHTIKDADFQAYFKNWARVWCMKAKKEYILLLLTNDVHAPTELRANMQPRNFLEWYQAFDVKDSDKMYLPVDKRVSIW